MLLVASEHLLSIEHFDMSSFIVSSYMMLLFCATSGRKLEKLSQGHHKIASLFLKMFQNGLKSEFIFAL